MQHSPGPDLEALAQRSLSIAPHIPAAGATRPPLTRLDVLLIAPAVGWLLVALWAVFS